MTTGTSGTVRPSPRLDARASTARPAPRLLRLPLIEHPTQPLRAAAVAAGAALLFGIARVQPQLYPDLPLSLLYLLPVVLVAWIAGTWAGVVTALAACAARLLVDSTTGVVPTAPSVPWWNFGITAAFYLPVAALLPQLHRTLLYERELARTDPLTLLGNRRFFEHVAGVELSRSRRYGRAFALAYIDVDHFKHVNDRLGHAEGDRLLRRVAALLVQALRTSDIVARLGGDEFAVLLPETPADGAAVAMQKVQERLTQALREESLGVSFSIGVVTYEGGAATLHELLDAADRAMYAVKRDGRNSLLAVSWPPRGDAAGRALHSAASSQ